MKKNTLIIIPAYNEEESILDVIQSLYVADKTFDIIVINDGSSDETSKLAKKTKKAIVIDLPTNVGIGGAVQTGFKYAYRHDYDVAVQFDGDGQHAAGEISKLINPLLEKEVDFVIGSRFLGDKKGFQSTLMRRIGIKVFQYVNSILIKQKVTDNTSGFRAYNKQAIKILAHDYPTDYPEPEAVIMLGKKGFKIKEVSVLMHERTGGTSSISRFKPIYYMIKVLLAIFMTYLRK
ncbi:Glycosyltransferase involved in cell wall biogenesis [hydrothermal vent metagenome]|uniref:Glycosyltransferase involved in cell wall biogenesis n=1 Tax=hydrothermal vent metagenome TaxID=652676 RepID=A0A3B1DTU0_9ZZZZ